MNTPPGSTAGLRTFIGRSITAFDPNPVTGYAQRWQLSVQREVQRILFDVAYVGNRGTKLDIMGRNLNAFPNKYLSTKPFRDEEAIAFFDTRFPNPLLPMTAGTNLASTTLSRPEFLVPYPHFVNITTQNNQGYSWYHSLQTKAERRFDRGFTFQGTYTWSKYMHAIGYLNPGDAMPEEVISEQDFPHRFSASGIYELPFGRGKQFASGSNGFVNRVVGGWQLSGTYTGQSGQALGFGDMLFYGDFNSIVLPEGQRTIQRWFNTSGFERNSSKAFRYHLRTAPSRFSGIRGDGINQMNLSVIKNTTIREGKQIQFRMEAMNALNHVMYLNPNTNQYSSAFGTISDEKGSMRTLQFGLKFLF